MNNFENSGFVAPYCPDFLVDFLKLNLPNKPQNIMDYGCGYGGWTLLIKNLISPKNICVYDIDTYAENFTRELVDANKLCKDVEKFDLILLMGVIECVDNYYNIISIFNELKDKLADNGKILLMTTCYEPLSIRWLYYLFKSNFNTKFWHNSKKFKRIYFNNNKLFELLNICDLKIDNKIYPRLIYGAPNCINQIGSKFSNKFHDLSFYILKKN